ncbi:hypothetical protein BHU72_14980 [Desulfuribacillus stibiiarsenatis]|uniref:Cytoplasmic protein n=1 Tax=Desulfuribacillus stibiiarsenatis TaxID=1390249 RepID=A0A1E5L7P7_9FIRM|nr:DUF1788 domain-containing protein [Desulfuribacillus stibiiarsenatis]OEH85983.1 hypothetical protein BHU72_14980 [Desulfuribacillus stibiiarsenatis]
MSNLNRRLDKVIPRIKEDKFVRGHGLGNEISFYVFDYEPEKELVVRSYVERIKKEFSHEGSNRKVIEFDLYKMLLEIAKERNIFDRIFEMEDKRGKEELFKAMANFAKPDIFLRKIKEQLEDHNVVLITGVGKVYPFVRSHTILNNLQEVIDKNPVIMFFPGKYDGQSLQLFGKFKDDNYYRAFPLVN